jgi:predicted secreted Zn-dependent protease
LAKRTGVEIVRHELLFLVALGAVLVGACSPESSLSSAGIASTPPGLASGSPRATSGPCVAAAVRLGAFTSQMAGDLASLRPLVVAPTFDSPEAIAGTRRVSATITSYTGLEQALLACQATADLGPRVAKLLANANATLAAAFAAEITNEQVQRDAAATLFALLPEVLRLASADQAVSGSLGIATQVAEVSQGADDPLGSLPPLPTPTPQLADSFVALPRLSVSIWRASVRYFSIDGMNPGELEASDQANIPNAADGDRVPNAFAYTEVTADTLEPKYLADLNSGSCRMLGATGTMTYRVTIPQWASPSRVLPQLLAWWKPVLEHTRWHEEQHVRIFEKWIPALGKRLAGHDCSSAPAIENRWSADMTAAQNAFDATERTWYLNYPYTGPWIN